MYDLVEASQIIKDSYFTHDSVTNEEITKELTNYLDDLVGEINNDPLYFFRDNHQFWRKLDKLALAKEQQLENVA